MKEVIKLIIKLDSINIKASEDMVYTSPFEYNCVKNIEGNIKVRLNGKYENGNYYNAIDYINIENISSEVKQKLVSLIEEIEKELIGK